MTPTRLHTRKRSQRHKGRRGNPVHNAHRDTKVGYTVTSAIPTTPYTIAGVDTTHWKAKDPDGKEHLITSAISPKREGTFLYNLVKHERMKKCVEVGFACGMSAMFMLHGMEDVVRSETKSTTKPGAQLISIDPYQDTQWHHVGTTHVKNAHFKHASHTWLKDFSYIALPALLAKHRSTFDLVFVDGMHTFDYTFVDAFYAVLLLRSGGYLVIDDAHHAGVQPVVQYLVTNYVHTKWKCLDYVSTPARSFAVFRKVCEDRVGELDAHGSPVGREWSFHRPFVTGRR